MAATGQRRTRAAERKAAWRLKHPKREMLSHARRRSRYFGVPFDLTENDFNIPDVCPVLNIPLSVAHGSKAPRDHSPTLDRVEPEKGYVKGNVQVISMLANSMKGEQYWHD